MPNDRRGPNDDIENEEVVQKRGEDVAGRAADEDEAEEFEDIEEADDEEDLES